MGNESESENLFVDFDARQFEPERALRRRDVVRGPPYMEEGAATEGNVVTRTVPIRGDGTTIRANRRSAPPYHMAFDMYFARVVATGRIVTARPHGPAHD